MITIIIYAFISQKKVVTLEAVAAQVILSLLSGIMPANYGMKVVGSRFPPAHKTDTLR